jgi:hypothetical protein
MRTAHFTAFDAKLKARVPALASLTFDGDAPLADGAQVLRKTYLVEHDMGFDAQSDGRLTSTEDDVSDGTYRVIVRVVATDRAGVRAAADAVKAGLVGQVLTIADRNCGPISKDAGPDQIERDDKVSPPLFFADLDFIWRSSRA